MEDKVEGRVKIDVWEKAEGTRLDVFLAENIEQSRSYIQKLIKAGNVTVDREPVTVPKTPVKSGNVVICAIPEPEELQIKAENLNLDIVYEDSDLLVVNKPKGMVVHPAAGHFSGTLVNGLLYHCGDSLSGINGVLRPGIVHRIDKDTTGLLLVCKNDASHKVISDQLRAHSITRRYEAVVYNNFSEDEGTVDKPLARRPSERKMMAVVESGHGKEAVTHYRVLDRLDHRFNHIECRLETGRTHQIRVHMAYIRHPLLGDTVYGPKPDKRFVNLCGQTLHAGVIGFVHPSTGEYMEFKVGVPEYFRNILGQLKA